MEEIFKITMNSKIIIKLTKKKKINLIAVDGVSCSGKSVFSTLIKKKIKNKFPNILILSKDLFLFSRKKRIKITKTLKNKTTKQNILHYDLKKLSMILNFLLRKSIKKKITLKNLYNRKTGKNDLSVSFRFSNNRLIIFEGILVSDDLKKENIKPDKKILIYSDLHNAMLQKIKRIRDKKISIQDVITEFINIHITSFKAHLNKHNFDICFLHQNDQKFLKLQKGRLKQIKNITLFYKKYNFNL